MSTRLQKGFTLIELMIVIAIIGILAAIAIPAYQDYTIRAQISEGLTVASPIQIAVAEYFAETGSFPIALTGGSAASALNFLTTMTGNYTSSVNIPHAGQIQIIYGNKANKLISGSVLYLNAYLTPAGDIDWVCGYASPPSSITSLAGTTGSSSVTVKYLPKNCQS